MPLNLTRRKKTDADEDLSEDKDTTDSEFE